MKYEFEKIWTLFVGITAILIRWLFDIGRAAKMCRLGADIFMNGCGWYQFFNIVLLLTIITFVGYFIYYNYDELHKHINNFLKKIKK